MNFSKWIESFLHGSDKLFSSFRRGGHGAIYFSDPQDFVGRGKIQAYAYAKPYLYTVEIVGGKRFDPLNDEKAMEIFKSCLEEKVWDYKNKIRFGRLDYQDAYLVIPEAEKHGYNLFRVYEVSVQNWSLAVTDPNLIKITNVVEYTD